MAELALFLSQKGGLTYSGNIEYGFVAYELWFGDSYDFDCETLTARIDLPPDGLIPESKEMCLEKLRQAYFDWCKEALAQRGVDHRNGKVWDAEAKEWVKFAAAR